MRRDPAAATPPRPPAIRFSLGLTGHHAANPDFATNRPRIEATLARLLGAIDSAVAGTPPPFGSGSIAPTRLHCLLADGADQMAAEAALARGWELVAPLPFGRDLNSAINARPASPADARALLRGTEPENAETRASARRLRDLAAAARLFELAEQDDAIAALFLATLEAPGDPLKAQAFAVRAAERAAHAARVAIEQSDALIGIWNGENRAGVGGTHHTIAAALELGAPVIWIDARNPEGWRILRAPESLAIDPNAEPPGSDEEIEELVWAALRPDGASQSPSARAPGGIDTLSRETWRPVSSRWSGAYRRIETLFGGEGKRLRSLRQTYESADRIASGSGAGILACARALPGGDREFAGRVADDVLRRFAWADGISAYLSDFYRGGMVASFLLSACAVVLGIAYQPAGVPEAKWLFASLEFLLLAAILFITWLGRKRRWHGRWFETRRLAEYFRHAPSLLLLGVARPSGRWPRGADTGWPEWYARQALRAPGLPRVAVTAPYLRAALRDLLDDHVVRQRDYHCAKATRLAAVHGNLDRLSGLSFQLAVASVALYLLLAAAAFLSLVPHDLPELSSRWFTFFGVLFPTVGAALAGIRYFGDFERFAAISEVTAEKLSAVHGRIRLLLAAPDGGLDHGSAADLAHVVDDIVVSEIENWQAVFGGKHITVPA